MKILITGSAGMLGSSMIPVMREVGYDVHPTDIRTEPGIDYLDVRDYEKILEYVQKLQPDFVFHLAAETDLEICEKDPHHAFLTNTIGTQNVALICKKYHLPMVYISTAGIFDGEKKESFYNEFDEVKPASMYGLSKYRGEIVVKDILENFFIFRPGWMIGGGKKDKKFVGKVLGQIRGGSKTLYAVDDKFGTPTYTKDFCKNLAEVIKTEYYGTYHMVCRGSASRFDVAREITKILHRPDIDVQKVHSDHFVKDYPVMRPTSEMLDNFALNLRGLNKMRNWRVCLEEYIHENFSDLIKQDSKETQHKKSIKEVTILGAGLAGLACAYKLLQQGINVTLLEKDADLGGLSKTIKYKDFSFDYSAHRFVGKNKELIAEMKNIMGENFSKRLKRSRILMWGRWLNYPFELVELMIAMPKGLALRAIVDYIRSFIQRKTQKVKIVSFKDWFIASFGKTLYETNCRPYVSKHWRRDPSEITSEWGEARSPANFNMRAIMRDLFKKRTKKLEEGNPYPDAAPFYYPEIGGIGAIPERLAKEIQNLGGRILTEVDVQKLDINDHAASVLIQRKNEKKEIKSDVVISTIPLNKLASIITSEIPEQIHKHLSQLRYLNTIFVNVIINKEKISNDSWLYFPQPSEEIIFNRAVEFKNWSSDMAPKNKTSLSLDISCTDDEDIWKNTKIEQIIEKSKEGLVKAKIIDSEDEVEEGVVVKVPNTYPIFDLAYPSNLQPVIQYLEKSGKLKLLGRTGKFCYANMDDVVSDAFKLAGEICSTR